MLMEREMANKFHASVWPADTPYMETVSVEMILGCQPRKGME